MSESGSHSVDDHLVEGLSLNDCAPERAPAGLAMKATPMNNYLSPALSDFHVLVSITSPEKTSGSKRLPTELCIVLDISGSMSGERIAFAKRAICDVLAQLTPEDRVHFVTYNTSASVVFKNERAGSSKVKALQNQVRTVRANGGTNIGAGLEMAASLFKPSDRALNRRVFLFSDGQNNAGHMRSTTEFARFISRLHASAQVSTSAFGIGTGFNEELMGAIAEAGEGHYFFIQSEAAIPDVVFRAFEFLTLSMGSGAQLEVHALGGAEVQRIYGTCSRTTAPIGTLTYGNTRTVLVQLSAPHFPPAAAGEGEEVATPVLTAVLTYRSLAGGRVTLSADASLVLTHDDAKGLDSAHQNADVAMEVATQLAADQEEAALQLLRKGEVEAARQITSNSTAQYRTAYTACSGRLSEKARARASKQAADMEQYDYSSGGSACYAKQVGYRAKQKRKGSFGFSMF